MTSKDTVSNLAMKILDEHPNGLKWVDLYNAIKSENPTMKNGTIVGSIRKFYLNNKNTVYKPDKGLYRLIKYQDNSAQVPTPTTSICEEDFYESFADWLENDQEECTKAITLGGNVFGGKWGTPDVIGVSKSSATDVMQKTTEIVTAEIKYNTNDLITAFGQSCSYKLFSHKVYLVIPEQSSDEEISRIDSLCCLFGIGLVLFDKTNPTTPKYQLKNRAQKGEIDYFYLNTIIDKARSVFSNLLS